MTYVTKNRLVVFRYKKSKYGYTRTDTILSIPEEVPHDCLLIDIINYAASKLDGYDSCFPYILNNFQIEVFLPLLKSKIELTLGNMLKFRDEIYIAQNNGLIKNYAVAICSAIKKTKAPLACGRLTSDWPRYKTKTAKSSARQISSNDIIWDEIKAIDNVPEARELAKERVSELVKDYKDAAMTFIDQYREFLIESKEIVERFKSQTLSKDRTVKKLIKIRKELGLNKETCGVLTNQLNDDTKGLLPPRIILSILVLLKLEYLHNTDVWLAIPLENLTVKKTSITISYITKSKTSKILPELTITNRERLCFKYLKQLINHGVTTRNLITSQNISIPRELLLFDYLTNRAKGYPDSKLRLVKDFQYLRGSAFKSFCEDAQIEYLSLDALRNLSATNKYLDGVAIFELQDILCHKDRATTEHYIEQYLTSALLKQNILCFMREIEADCLIDIDDTRFSSKQSKKQKKKYFLLGDGSSCQDKYDSPDKHQKKGDLCNGKYCHIGCDNNKIILNKDSIWQALIRREYYRTNYFSMVSNRELFSAFDSHKILFNALLCNYIEKKQSNIFKEFMKKINNKINIKRV